MRVRVISRKLARVIGLGSFLNSRIVLIFSVCGFSLLCVAARYARAQLESSKTITDAQSKFFESRVRPILAERCFSCHGADKQSGGLRLDSADSVRKGGASGMAVITGNPDESRLIRNIRYDGPVKMPPGGKLRPDEIAALAEWVKMGAPWPETPSASGSRKSAGSGGMVITEEHRRFWAFRPISRPRIPSVKNTSWARNPIDAFVLAKLEARGLTPAPPTDRRTLIRRAYFDLIGLPPTPEEVEAFVADRSPHAWETVIDKLLASPHYGERWGRHWLDIARYADSNGLDENKAFAHAFRYRDYVIDSLNKDKPYDRFLTEQLAGDLLPAESDEQRNEQTTATGFLVLGAKVLAEQDKPKLVMDIVDEQIEVVSKAFMGLTIACARCHDHKFDPITTRDYYALAGILKSTRSMKDLSFVSNWMEKPLLTDEWRRKQKAHDERIASVRADHKSALDAANLEVVRTFRKDAAKYLVAGWELAQSGGLLSVADIPARPGETKILIEAEKFDRATGIMVETETYGRGIGVIINNAVRDEIEWDVSVPTAGPFQVEIRYAAAESRPVRLLLNGKTLREKTARQVTGSWNPDGQRWEPQGVFLFQTGKNTLRIERDGPIPHFDKLLIASANGPIDKPVRTPEEIAKQYGVEVDVLTRWAQRLRGGSGDPSFSAWHAFAQIPADEFSTRGPELAAKVARGELPVKVAPEVTKAFEGYSPINLTEVATRYAEVLNTQGGIAADRFDLPEKPERFYSAAVKESVKKAEDAVKSAESQEPPIPIAMAVEDAPKIENVRVHVRGSTLNLGDEVPRRFLTVLHGDTRPLENRGSGRLQLAQWLTNPAHPLTSRVAVNRIWQGHFGHGFVRTSDNWGFLGDKPTHPELLDWLANEFMNQGNDGRVASANPSSVIRQPSKAWSLKRLHRLIMTSNTYKMSTRNDEAAFMADPENKLLWRMNRRRMEAEPFRDALLAVSGNLDRQMGGSLLTSKNNDYVTNDQSGNAARYDNHRRSVYLPVIRNALFDMFQAFDVGDPTLVNAKRSSTTVAPQALYILNSPFAIEQARDFAKRMLSDSGLTDEGRVDRAYRIAFARPATAVEKKKALAYVVNHQVALAKTESDSGKQREKAWTSFCQILLASNEFIYLN